MAVGDFNGDEKPDLAVTGNGVRVLIGNGDGTFQVALESSAVSGFPVVSDFNGDGKLDLAIANSGSGNVSVLLGRGDGTFRAAVGYDAGSGPQFVAVGDFNGDGKLDLAVANMGTYDQSTYEMTNSSVSVLLGEGDGTFRAPVNYDAGSNPRSVTVGDFNGDGKMDLAVANDTFSGKVSVLLGKGDGTFQAAINYDVGAYPFFVAVADFNTDGKADLIVGYCCGASVLFGKGDGTFQPAVQDGAVSVPLPSSLAVGDFNGDGKPDLTLGSLSGVSVRLGNGDGTFQTAPGYGGEPHYAAVGDFNGDGKLDLALAESDPDNVLVLLGNGDGTFQSAGYYRAGKYPGAIAVEDFNADGKADLAVANSDGVSVLLGKGDGTFRSAVNYAAGTNPQSVAVADFNGDGKPDLAQATSGWFDQSAHAFTNSGISVLLGKGDGTFQVAVNYAAGTYPRSVTVGDFNRDGKLDLVVLNASTNVSLLLGNGDGSFQRAVNSGAGVGPSAVTVSDFNGDGNSDLLIPNFVPCDWGAIHNVSMLFGKGDGTFRSPVILDFGTFIAPPALPGFLAVGDFDGDGRPDLAIISYYSTTSTSISVMLGKGDGAFQSSVNFKTGGNPFFATVGDFNGDGKSDLAVLNSSGVAVLLNTCASAGIHLGVARTNTGLTLSWPLPYTDFVLESTTSFNSTNWQRPIEALTTNNGRLEVAAPFDQPGRFFRLRKP